MRTTFTVLALLIGTLISAQAPAVISYQAVARNEAGQPIANSSLNARFTLHNETAAGVSVWQEIQTVNTTALGLFTAKLGQISPLTNVNWSNGAKFMQVEVDLGAGFIDLGTQQLLSVPYAQYARGVDLNISSTGDSLFIGQNSFIIIPGISEINGN